MARPAYERLGTAFRAAYQAAGLRQEDVAAALDVDQGTVSKWGRGLQRIPLDVLPVVDKLCDRPTGYVLRLAGYVKDDPRGDIVAAIQADPNIVDDTARRILVTLYELSLKPGVRDATDAKVADKRPIANSTS